MFFLSSRASDTFSLKFAETFISITVEFTRTVTYQATMTKDAGRITKIRLQRDAVLYHVVWPLFTNKLSVIHTRSTYFQA